MELKGRRIVLGVTGGIAAYKAAELVRLLGKQGADVQVAMTQGAAHFVTATTFQALSGKPVTNPSAVSPVLLKPLSESAEGLTGMDETDQRLIAELTPGPTKDRAYRVEAELHRLTRLSEKLMQLAKAEGGAVLQDRAQDLCPILNAVVDEFARHGHAARLQLALPKTPALSRMDPDAFGILVRNLIENALRHGDSGGTVFVDLQADGLAVRNGGKIIPADRLAALSGRFIRGETKGEGSGLGLAVSKTIAEAAGGGLVLSSPATGQTDGFEARVTFPAMG